MKKPIAESQQEPMPPLAQLGTELGPLLIFFLVDAFQGIYVVIQR